jgi:hypothetical protein
LKHSPTSKKLAFRMRASQFAVSRKRVSRPLADSRQLEVELCLVSWSESIRSGLSVSLVGPPVLVSPSSSLVPGSLGCPDREETVLSSPSCRGMVSDGDELPVIALETYTQLPGGRLRQFAHGSFRSHLNLQMWLELCCRSGTGVLTSSIYIWCKTPVASVDCSFAFDPF